MSEILLSSQHEDEIFSIATADEDDLLGPEKDGNETLVNENQTSTNGVIPCAEELEEGEIGDDQEDELTVTSFPVDSQKQNHKTTTEPQPPPSICQFVAVEPKDVGCLTLTAENLQNFDSRSLNGSLIRTFEEFDLNSRRTSSFKEGTNYLHEEKQVRIRHFLKSLQREYQRDCNSPYPKSIDRRTDRSKTNKCFSQGSVSSNQSVISNLVVNFQKVNVSNQSKNDSAYSSSSGLLAKARLKLANTSLSTSLNNHSAQSDISVKNDQLNETYCSLNEKNNQGMECFSSTCTELDKLKISEVDTDSTNLFKRRKPNLINGSLKNNRGFPNQKIKKIIVKPKEKATIRNKVKKQINITNNRVIPVINLSSDDDSSEKSLQDSKKDNGFGATRQSQTSDRNVNSKTNDKCTISKQSSFSADKIKIVFSGIFTLLDKHRMFDCCEENYRYVVDFKIDMSKAEAIVICRSTESALKFISQRTSDSIRQFKIISVEQISNWSF